MSNEKLIPDLRFPEFQNEEDWKVKTIDELCDILNNIRKPISSGDRKKGSYPYYGASGIIDYVDDYLFDERLLLIGEDGAKWGAYENTAFLVEGKYWVNNHAHVLKPKLSNDKLLESYLVKLDLHPYITGAAPPKLTLGKLKEIPVPVPENKIEQQKIASCLSSLDDLIAAHIQKLNLLKDHKKGLMQNLFPQMSESGFTRLKDDRMNGDELGTKNQKILKSKNPTNPDSDNVPKYRFKEFEKDGEWVEKKLESYIDLFSGIALKSEELSDDESGIPILRGINITEGYIRHSSDIDKYFLGDLENLEKYLVKENDIVIGMDGSKVGKNVAMITKQDENSILIQRVARIRANKDTDVNFVYQYFISDKFRSYVGAVNTSSGIPHISAQQIKDSKVGFPPKILEQQKIASCLSSLDALITAQAEKIEQLKLHKKGLMQGLFPKINDR